VDEAAQRADAEGALMATYLSPPGGALPVGGPPFSPESPLFTIHDWAALASAPRRPFGTEVSVRATPVAKLGGIPDHMFVEYDDGQNQLTARGNPSKEGDQFVAGVLDGANRVTAAVTPATLSKDYGARYRTMGETFLPGVTADQAAAPARAHAAGVNRGGNAYGPLSNSNSYAADVGEPLLGFRPGDGWTWGFQRHLTDQAPPHSEPGNAFSGPIWSDDLTPVIRVPPY
jgi:hypothetical protein